MRLIKIESKEGDVVVNTSQICRLYMQSGVVVITSGDDAHTETLFTDIDHAVDFIQRAPSCSFGK